MQTKEYNLIRNSTIWIRLKLADMATSYAGESATYRAQNIEDRIIAREAEGQLIKKQNWVLEDTLLSVHIKVAVSRCSNCSDEGIQILVEWDSEDTPMECLERCTCLSMKVQTKSTECFL
jgi:hypothetical protein